MVIRVKVNIQSKDFEPKYLFFFCMGVLFRTDYRRVRNITIEISTISNPILTLSQRIIHYYMIEDLNMVNIIIIINTMHLVLRKKHSSYLLESRGEMFPRLYKGLIM